MVEVLGPLSARPPTPPRTSSRMLSENYRTEDSPVVVHTPRDSPFSVNGSTGAPSSRQSKRVNFSPWTRYIKPPSFTNSAAKSKSDLKSLPPSNECKPTKSILKPTTSHSATNSPSAEPQAPVSFAMLLESILQQLAGEAVSSRLDAYMQFFGALRAYDNLPGDQEIIARLGLITQFIHRDVSRDLTTGGPLHTNLVIQALKLAVALVWHSEISARLPDDFKTFLVDHSVNCLQDVKMPKSVVTHYLSVLSTQNFNAKVMTNTRIIRILTVLHELTNRVTGSAIVSQRLSIYLRVLNQSKMIFVSNASLWMDHLISGLLHHVKDIRIKAISVGFQTAIACGPNPTLSKCVREVFSRPLDERRKLVTEVCERMTRMMALSDCGVHIPQIWSVIILLLRSKKFNVDQWEHFKEWVLVLQRCFNCSDSAIKAQAIVGWNRFVYVVSPSDTTSPSLLRMLSKPIISQFDRKKQDKQPSQLALCSYYNLLYYAFRPSASFQHLDVVWEEYVASPASSIFSSVPSLSDRVAHVLSNMLWSPQAKVWLENKVNESNKLDPEELPSIDSRWIRSRITSVLSVFEEIFKSSVWNPDIERSNIATAWIGLSKALSHASSKEITPTPESMQAVAHVLGLLQRLWNAGPSSLNAAIEKDSTDAFYDRFSFLSTTMIYSLGSARFIEKLLLKTADETFQAATTPTHRHQKANTSLDSPILHFLRFISELPGHSGPSPPYSRLVTSVLEATCSDKLSRSSRLEFFSQCADIHVFDAAAHIGDDSLAETVWRSVAQLSASSLSSFPMETARERDGSVCRDYENIVNILSAGLKFSDVFEVWNPLVDSLIRVVRTEKGDRAISTMAMEPLAASIIEQGTRNTCKPSASLLKLSLSIPYGHEAETAKGTHEMAFPHKLIELVDKTLRQSYESFDPVEPNGIADFIECLTSLLGSGVPTFRTAVLTHLQQSLALYLKDKERKINAESGVESRILTACRALSSAVLNILQAAQPHDAFCVQKFEPIICAGLESTHASVTKRFLDFWRCSFGSQESLPCPETISRALHDIEVQMKLQQPHGHRQNLQSEAQSDRQDAKAFPVDTSVKSRIAFILDDPFTLGLNSSPITGGSERKAMPTSSEKQTGHSAGPLSQTDDDSDPDVATGHSMPLPTGSGDPRKRSELFSIIESLRSSSPPTNTPRELGFMTPPHLRDLRNADADAGTPQTPTLPPVATDNEYGFLGSSPTPGTRSLTQLSEPEIPQSLSTPAAEESVLENELQSSPPKLKSTSPEPRSNTGNMNTPGSGNTASSRSRRSKRRARRSSRQKKAMNAQSSQPEATDESMAVDSEEPLTKRLRSSTGKLPEDKSLSIEDMQSKDSSKNGSRDSGLSQDPVTDSGATEEPVIEPEHQVNAEQPKDKEKQQTDGYDYIADSCSDDMETQVASQLEQDLELAVDLDDTASIEHATASEQGANKKRKREAEQSTPSDKERRRSSRLTKTSSVVDIEGGRATRSKRPMTVSQEVESSPAESAPKRRKTESKSDMTGTSKPAEQSASTDSGKTKVLDTQDSSQKRRSSRLSGQAAPAIPEESPLPKRSPRPSRSRKATKDKTKDSIPEEPQLREVVETHHDETPTIDAVDQPVKDEKEPKITAEDKPAEQLPEPDSSVQPPTEAQVDEPMDEPVPETQQTAPDDVQMEDAPTVTKPIPEKKAPSEEKELETTEKKTRAVSRTTQTEGQKEPEITEAGITDSLRKVLSDVKLAKLDRNSLKEIDDLLFDIRVETHEALRRNTV
ncbi:putative telomere length regulator protein (Rif1) [Aspergillus neoniger CBS 115656]|uniref:Telomere length regulator protein n=1 Tax=Aspergillus neoniger (strain CBS 115656) TaxID=1448310 RepID=A0A318YNJ8_ASPNB|nr:telomere length regulator protein [Aspergillus neoniger CBS 115656]PYH36265.1 telomere length regulator protein [Aspergillus neoniger CBS 115656]